MGIFLSILGLIGLGTIGWLIESNKQRDITIALLDETVENMGTTNVRLMEEKRQLFDQCTRLVRENSDLEIKHRPWNKGKSGYKLNRRKATLVSTNPPEFTLETTETFYPTVEL